MCLKDNNFTAAESVTVALRSFMMPPDMQMKGLRRNEAAMKNNSRYHKNYLNHSLLYVLKKSRSGNRAARNGVHRSNMFLQKLKPASYKRFVYFFALQFFSSAFFICTVIDRGNNHQWYKEKREWRNAYHAYPFTTIHSAHRAA